MMIENIGSSSAASGGIRASPSRHVNVVTKRDALRRTKRRSGAKRPETRPPRRRRRRETRSTGLSTSVRLLPLDPAPILHVGGDQAEELAGDGHHLFFAQPALAQLAVNRLGED